MCAVYLSEKLFSKKKNKMGVQTSNSTFCFFSVLSLALKGDVWTEFQAVINAALRKIRGSFIYRKIATLILSENQKAPVNNALSTGGIHISYSPYLQILIFSYGKVEVGKHAMIIIFYRAESKKHKY